MTPNELQTKVEELEALSKTGNDYAQAETQARLLLAEAGIENEPELHCKVLLALSYSQYLCGLSQNALTFAKQALSIAQDNQLKALEARALNSIGNVYSHLSDYAKALEYYGKALAIYEELGNTKLSVGTINNIGNVYRKTSEYLLALQHFQKALAINEELENKSWMAINLGNCGNVYNDLSDYAKALEYYGKALALNEELGSKDGIARNLANCGIIYQNLSDYAKALEYYGKALALNEKLGSQYGIANNLDNCGAVYFHLSDYSKALEYFGKALALNEELGNKSGFALITGNIGNVYNGIGDYSRALEYYSRALSVHEELGEKSGIARVTGNIGGVFANKEFEGYNAEKAEEYLLKSLAMFEEIGARKQLYELHQNLAELYEKTDRKSEAFDHLKKYHELKDKVQSEEAKKQSDRLDYERKTAEREKLLAVERAEAATVKRILHNTLPPIIADRLINNETFIADSYPNVSVLFMDLVNFTRIAAIIPPRHLIYLLNTIFSNADAVMEKHGLEKIKTIGDAYMAVAGAPVHQDDHAHRAAQAAIDVMEAMNNLSVIIPEELGETSWTAHVGEIQVRIGLHCGEAIGGVIGDKKFSFDLWGDAVNTAARMESHGEAGKIHCSEEFKNALGETQGRASLLNNVQFIPRGEMEIKGKGIMKTFFLERT